MTKKEEPPEHYFCPKCNHEMTLDMVALLRGQGLPSMAIVNIALHILADADCPANLTKPIYEWMETYGDTIDELSEEEHDKLALLKWNRWAMQD